MNHETLSLSLLKELKKSNPLNAPFLEASSSLLTQEEWSGLDHYLEFCLSEGLTLAYLVQCYDRIAQDTLREQIYFRKNKRYRYSTYAEVASSVYLNSDYMKMYMYGLALTSFLWPNHLEMTRWFQEKLPKSRSGRYLEVGPGHGYQFMNSMRLTSFDFFEGIDISPASVALTRAVLQSGKFKNSKNFEIHQADFLKIEVQKRYDAVVMSEVLEHVEDPGAFLRKIGQITAEAPFIFVTTVANAPAVDHIHLFRSPEEILSLAQECGLRVVDQLLIPYAGSTLAACRQKSLPISVAAVLGK